MSIEALKNLAQHLSVFNLSKKPTLPTWQVGPTSGARSLVHARSLLSPEVEAAATRREQEARVDLDQAWEPAVN